MKQKSTTYKIQQYLMFAGPGTLLFFLSITRCFVVYDVNLSLTKGEPFNSSVMAAMHVYNQAFTYKNYGVGQAEALILFVVCAIVGVTQVMVGKKGEVDA